jgi:hypothetical protein
MSAKAQRSSFGVEKLIPMRNIYIGIKGGVTAMDMQYKDQDGNQYVNHSTLYQDFNILNYMAGGVYVERSLPNFSYGLELCFSHINAEDLSASSQYSQDAALFTGVRIPLKIKLFEDKLFSPYIIVSPGVSTYVNVTDTIADFFKSFSIWDNEPEPVEWNNANTNSLNINVTGGLGVEAKIPLMVYEVRARLEVNYNLGLLNMTPKDLDFERRMRGWEATIGLAFPLFTNPSYGWFN